MSDYGQHDDHGHHGSWAPIIASSGTMLFLYGFSGANIGLIAVGLGVMVWGLFVWWAQDMPFDGSERMGELVSWGTPFGGINVRKAGMWIFLMSEVMIFATFFTAYIRARSNWTTYWDVECNSLGHGGGEHLTACPAGYEIVAAEYITASFQTLLPGAINTFALILSSFTLVLALKAAKNADLDVRTRSRKVRNYLGATMFLGTLFLVLKLIEWNHLIHEGFTIATLPGSYFYVTTGAHGLHVFIGLVFISYFIWKAHKGGWDPSNAQSIEYYGLYWHFVDLAWVLIFPAFYLY